MIFLPLPSNHSFISSSPFFFPLMNRNHTSDNRIRKHLLFIQRRHISLHMQRSSIHSLDGGSKLWMAWLVQCHATLWIPLTFRNYRKSDLLFFSSNCKTRCAFSVNIMLYGVFRTLRLGSKSFFFKMTRVSKFVGNILFKNNTFIDFSHHKIYSSKYQKPHHQLLLRLVLAATNRISLWPLWS